MAGFFMISEELNFDRIKNGQAYRDEFNVIKKHSEIGSKLPPIGLLKGI